MKQDKTYIIAEIGKNFIQTKNEQSVEMYLKNAKELVIQAHKAGADAVKFQTHNLEDEQIDENIVSKHFTESDRYSWVKRNTLSTPIDLFWEPIKNFCDDLGITFFSTPMSKGAAIILNDLGVQLWKVGSGDILDFVLLDYISKTKKPLIISSGMSTLDEIDKMVSFLQKRNVSFSLLHCVSIYPCPLDELNIGTMNFFKERYEVPIGFSDHSLSTKSALVAVSLGAKIIEKHFTLKRNFWGSDHKSSLEPNEFGEMVESIRQYENGNLKVDNQLRERCYGKKEKLLQRGEKSFRQCFRKTLVAARDLPMGITLTINDIFAMRPQQLLKGIPSEELFEVIGKKLKKPLLKYTPFQLKNII